MPLAQLSEWAESADRVFAADGAADRLLAAGRRPDVVIGDLDSIGGRAREILADVRHDPDQDTSDADKLLTLAASEGVGTITLAGAEGDLLDHVLGTLQSALRSPLRVRLALRQGLGWIVKGPVRFERSTAPGSRFSVVPLTVCHGVTLRGAQWPLAGATLDPFGLTSLSNRAAEAGVFLEIEEGAAFVFAATEGRPEWDTSSTYGR